jgi:hypothetical protein
MANIQGTANSGILTGSAAADTRPGLAGDDAFYGLDGDDRVAGDLGDDVPDGGAGLDITMGEALGDSLNGLRLGVFAGTLRLEGGAIRLVEGGNDRLQGGRGADGVLGGTGSDAVLFTTPTRVNLASTALGLGAAGGDSFDRIEPPLFSDPDSSYVGGTAAIQVVLSGGSLTGFAGAGAKTLRAPLGALTASYRNAAPVVTQTRRRSTLCGPRAATGNQPINAAALTLSSFGGVLNPRNRAGPTPATLLAGNGNDTPLIDLSPVGWMDGGSGWGTLIGALGVGRERRRPH